MRLIVPCLAFALCLISGRAPAAETNVVGGVTYVCEEGVCRMVDADAPAATRAPTQASGEGRRVRLAQGYMDAETFLAFLENRPPEDPFDGKGIVLVLLMTFFGGLLMNLTPCVLPMIPVNLLIIGKSAKRGAWYGLGIVLAYGMLGVLAAIGGLAFGSIQSNAWFNGAVALVFAALALSLFGVFPIDVSKYRRGLHGGAFLMGVLAAVLAGACVAPVLIAVLLLTARLYAAGHAFALGLPFVLGLGMALPWPLAGAGLAVLPKPGAWMKWVNRAFGAFVLGLAVWHGALACRGWAPDGRREGDSAGCAATPATFEEVLGRLPSRPVLVDCWASWCKNCAVMERRTLADPRVREALKRFTLVRLQAEDMRALRRLPGFETVFGLPAFVIIE